MSGGDMETVKYKTTVKGSNIQIPEHILEQLGRSDEVEVVFRPIRRALTNRKDIKKIIDQIETEMNKKYPHLRKPLNKRLRGIVGLSSDIHDDLLKYSDKEILAMARMEKLSADYAD